MASKKSFHLVGQKFLQVILWLTIKSYHKSVLEISGIYKKLPKNMASVEKKKNNSVVFNLYIELYDSFEKDNHQISYYCYITAWLTSIHQIENRV